MSVEQVRRREKERERAESKTGEKKRNSFNAITFIIMIFHFLFLDREKWLASIAACNSRRTLFSFTFSKVKLINVNLINAMRNYMLPFNVKWLQTTRMFLSCASKLKTNRRRNAFCDEKQVSFSKVFGLNGKLWFFKTTKYPILLHCANGLF